MPDADRCFKKCESPIALVDPMVRALNTVMFGLVIHFGTLWAFGDLFGDSCGSQRNVGETSSDWSDWLRTATLLHEYWVYLQHLNVLANPYCQRLDRQYGIALLKSNQHWAIAGTLSVSFQWLWERFIPCQSAHLVAWLAGILVSRIAGNVSLFAIST